MCQMETCEYAVANDKKSEKLNTKAGWIFTLYPSSLARSL